jgi:hypothetical protein
MNLFNTSACRSVSASFTVFVILMLFVFTAQAQTNAFTYQGRFADTTAAQPTNGSYDMTFRLFDAATNGNQIPNSSTQVASLVTVTNGIFTVRLDFGPTAFATTGARYLEIQVGTTVLTPRQEITSAPFSMRAVSAANADSLGGVAANQYVQTNDPRLTDSRSPTAGSSNYVQNTGTQQSATFNISGSGTLGGTLSSNKVITNGVLARGGAPGGFGASNNGYAFSGNGGDNDSGLFGLANGQVGLYADNVERLHVDGAGISVTGDISATGTITGTLANNSVNSAQVTDGSLRLADMAILNTTVSLPQTAVGGNNCVGLNLNLSPYGVQAGDIAHLYFIDTTPGGLYIQPVIVTDPSNVAFWLCNSLAAGRTAPAQSVRIVLMRP